MNIKNLPNKILNSHVQRASVKVSIILFASIILS